ncbi:TAXI family TRAP transporter solute-binding subunit [Salinadaptatus halalkaliphilus]|uniref:TAXI family TRAP transporter solute-binding subunit n=1 Tax=Salinadaptatus halalkaliphilus TaxID=2419781 RepID=A0A4S3TTP3_9EURY|nr:TAXI family TRAP transporter solute-binding subunit [Salinadaptatus halalkaliphilus]THE65998.1 TAXI family TRAP transporter solute-binding subunit [Salinadaptatus halalkaliphilus]
MDQNRGVNRRTFIGASGIAGVGILAGCLDTDDVEDDVGNGIGDGNGNGGNGGDAPDDAEDLVMVTSGEETGTYAASQGIAATVNQNTDEVFIDARPSGGTDDNVGMMNRGEAEIGYLQHRSSILINDGEEPYDEIDFTPQQLFHHSDLPWLLVTPNEDWETVEDIEPDSRVSPTPSGSGSAPVLEQALDYAGVEFDRVSYEFGEQAGAMQEGELDVAAITVSNFEFEAAWIQEMKQVVDTRILGWPDDAVDEMEDDEIVPAEPFEIPDDLAEGYAYVPDQVYGINIPYNFVATDEVPYDPVYEMLEVMWDNREEMAETHLYQEYMVDAEWWATRMYDGVPIHPAAADFFEERDIWQDDFVRGEIEN